VGPRELMQVFDEIFFSFTFGGETLSLAATKATIEKIQREHVIEHLWRQGKTIQSEFNTLVAGLGLGGLIQCIGLPPRTVVTFKDRAGNDSLALRSLFQQEMVKRGMLFLVGFNIALAHGDGEVDRTLEACRAALDVVAGAVDTNSVERRLDGPMVQAVFRRA
jgi:4-aminobutyrate aminotransferase-like enzyme